MSLERKILEAVGRHISDEEKALVREFWNARKSYNFYYDRGDGEAINVAADRMKSAVKELTELGFFERIGMHRMPTLDEIDKSVSEDAKGPTIKTLKKNQRSLTDEERAECKKMGMVWHSGPNGEAQCAARKAVVNGKTWWWVGTHRAWSGAEPTLKALKKHWKFIKSTA